MSTFDLTPPTEAQRREITAGLSATERRVLLQHGTEAAFCGVFLDNKKDGIYTCRFCGLPLFRSSAKFDSGTGWPSFFEPYDEVAHQAHPRHQLRHGPGGGGVRALRQPPRPRISRRPAAHRRAALPEFGVAVLYRKGPAAARCAGARRARRGSRLGG